MNGLEKKITEQFYNLAFSFKQWVAESVRHLKGGSLHVEGASVSHQLVDLCGQLLLRSCWARSGQ